MRFFNIYFFSFFKDFLKSGVIYSAQARSRNWLCDFLGGEYNRKKGEKEYEESVENSWENITWNTCCTFVNEYMMVKEL